MAYSKDFRERAAAYKQEGHTFKQLREAFGIPPETYYGWKKKLAGGYYNIPAKRERKRKIDKEKLKQAAKDKPDGFLKEYAEPFGHTPAAAFRALKNLISREKKIFAYHEKSGRKRAEYPARLKRVPKKKRVYAGESGIHSFLQREYARSARETGGVVWPGKCHRVRMRRRPPAESDTQGVCRNHGQRGFPSEEGTAQTGAVDKGDSRLHTSVE